MKFPSYIVGGFALFAMFFGAGNLLYPIGIGIKSAEQYAYGSLGLLLTGILLPIAGTYAFYLCNGSEDEFFKIGTIPRRVLVTLIILITGPFGATPRCLLVSYGSFSVIFPSTNLYLFILVYCLLSAVALYDRSKIVDLIGKILTPMLLFILIALGIAIFIDPASGSIPGTSTLTPHDAFFVGVVDGYSTMDLLGATLFGSIAYAYLVSANKNRKKDLKDSASKACFVAMLLLCSVYLVLVHAGQKFSGFLATVEPQVFVATISGHVFGTEIAKYVVAAITVLACFTTSTALMENVCTKTCNAVNLIGGNISRRTSIIITVASIFIMSLTGFSFITKTIVEVMTILYPALTGLVIGRIFDKKFNFNYTKYLFWCCASVSAANYLYKGLI